MRKSGIRCCCLVACIVTMLAATACGNQSTKAARMDMPTVAESAVTETAVILETVTETTEVSKESLQDELLTEYAREKYMQECTSVGYKELMRYQDEHKGKKLYLTVKVAQITDGSYRCYSEDNDEYIIMDCREYDNTKILVDDILIAWGDYAGSTMITRAINNVDEEVPQIDARYIDIYDDTTIEDYKIEQGSVKADSYYVEATQQESISQQNYETLYVVNCSQSITLRTSPSTSATEVCQIPLGAAVSYVATAENGFYKVIYLGKTGYALASYLGYEPQAQEPIYVTMRVVNCKESITLRTSPSTSAKEVCQIPLWATVSYIESAANGFYKVTYHGKTGYALASYLEFD